MAIQTWSELSAAFSNYGCTGEQRNIHCGVSSSLNVSLQATRSAVEHNERGLTVNPQLSLHNPKVNTG